MMLENSVSMARYFFTLSVEIVIVSDIWNIQITTHKMFTKDLGVVCPTSTVLLLWSESSLSK